MQTFGLYLDLVNASKREYVVRYVVRRTIIKLSSISNLLVNVCNLIWYTCILFIRCLQIDLYYCSLQVNNNRALINPDGPLWHKNSFVSEDEHDAICGCCCCHLRPITSKVLSYLNKISLFRE